MDINTHSTLKTSLSAYWTLDANFNDSHTTAHHGTFYNTPTFPVAKLRTGVKFTAASSQYGKVTDHADFQGATCSYAFWFKVDAIPSSSQYLLSHIQGGTFARNVQIDSGGTIHVTFPDSFIPVTVPSMAPIVAGRWYHLLAFQGGGVVAFYLNNVDQGTIPAFSVAGVSADLYLGSTPTPGQYFDGIIDDFGWWNKILSSGERNDLYQSGIGITWDGTFTSIKTHPTLRSGMLCHYKFDGNLNDSLGNFNGTAYGSVSYDTGKTGQAATVWTPTYVDLGSQGAWNTSYLSVAFWTYCYIVQNKYPIGRQIGATSCWRMPGYFNWQRFFLTRSGSLDEAQVMLDNLDNSAWNFVAATYDGTDMKISKNAGTPNVTNFPGTIRSASVNTWIGHEYDANSTLDGLSVWDRPLAQSEIVALYNSGNGLTYSIPSAASGVFTSAQSGPWSDPATWGTEDTYPGDGSTVTISAGHTVTIDGSHTVGTAPTNDTTMVLTINNTGWLKWADSPAADWTFTIKGNVSIVKGGKFSVGTSSARIPSARTAIVSLPAVNITGWKIQVHGTLEVYGAEAYHMADATKQRSLLAYNLMSGTGTTLKLTDAVDWQAGDTVVVSSRDSYTQREALVIQTKVDAYTYTVNPTYCHLAEDFVVLNNRNVRFEGYNNAGRGVTLYTNITSSADCDSAKLDLNWCSFKFFGRNTSTTAGTQFLYYYIVVSNTPNKSIPDANFKLTSVVIDELSNRQPDGAIYVESDLAFSGSANKLDGVHFTHLVRRAVQFSVDGFFPIKNITLSYVESTYWGVYNRWGASSIDGGWFCTQWQLDTGGSLLGFYSPVQNSRFYGCHGVYTYRAAYGGDNFRYPQVNEVVVNNCKFYGTYRGVASWTSNIYNYGIDFQIYVKNSEFYANWIGPFSTPGTVSRVRIENCTIDGIGDYNNTDIYPFQISRDGAAYALRDITIANCTIGRYNPTPNAMVYNDGMNGRMLVNLVNCDVYQPWALAGSLGNYEYQDWLYFALFRFRQYHLSYENRWTKTPYGLLTATNCKILLLDGFGNREMFSQLRRYRKAFSSVGSELRDQFINVYNSKFPLRLVPFSACVEPEVNKHQPVIINASPNKRITTTLKFKQTGASQRTRAGLTLYGGGIFSTTRMSVGEGIWETLTVQGDCNPDVTEGVKYLSGVVGNLVGYWPLNGDALDAHTNNLDGTIEGSPTYAAGKLDRSINLSGSSQCINLGTSSLLNPQSAITVCTWVKLDSASGYPFIVCKRYEDGVELNEDASWWIMVNEGKWEVGVYTISRDLLQSTFRVETTNWHFVALTYDSTNIGLFVDGLSLSKTHANPGLMRLTGSVPALIGAECYTPKPTGRWHYLDGKVSDVSIFNRALNIDELASIYRLGRGLRYELIKQYLDTTQINLVMSAGMNVGDFSQRYYTELYMPGRVIGRSSAGPTGMQDLPAIQNVIDVDALTVVESDIP